MIYCSVVAAQFCDPVEYVYSADWSTAEDVAESIAQDMNSDYPELPPMLASGAVLVQPGDIGPLHVIREVLIGIGERNFHVLGAA